MRLKFYKCSTFRYSWIVKDEKGKELFCINREVLPGKGDGYTSEEMKDIVKKKMKNNDIEFEFGGSCF